jgi:carboxyl-terminal processing protease
MKASRFFSSAGLALAGAACATLVLLPTPGIAASERQNPYFLLEQLGRALVLVENEYVDPVDRERLIEGAIKGMVAELDPHSSYLPAEDYAIFQGDTEGKFGGIGVEVDFADEYVTVIAPIEGSPAERAGIRPGDRIFAIDNVGVRGKSSADLVRMMRGDPGTKVLLTIRRDGLDKYLYFSLSRQVITVASIASKLLADGVGYLKVKTFQSGTHSEFLDQLAELKKKNGGNLAGVVLDMRNNPGGLVNEANAIADEFLSRGVIFTTRRRGTIVDEVRADSAGALRRGPVVVLVNEYSASAAELVAGALQDNRRAPVVGAPTFGKGSVQTIIEFPGGAGLRLTTLRYYTPSGRAIQAQGVKPDVLIGGTGFSIREENLEGHLPAIEGKTPITVVPPTDLPDAGASNAADAGASPEADLIKSREVPTNPEQGDDEVLKVGYQIVTGRYGKKPTLSPK